MGYFLGLVKFHIFFGVLEIPDIFFGRTVDAGSEPTSEEKVRVPPGGGGGGGGSYSTKLS